MFCVQCTQSFDSEKGEQVEEVVDEEGVCQFSVPDVSISALFDSNSTNSSTRENCPQVCLSDPLP